MTLNDNIHDAERALKVAQKEAREALQRALARIESNERLTYRDDVAVHDGLTRLLGAHARLEGMREGL